MKAGILTFHYAYNYGAILQAYALQRKICEMKSESEIIDYRGERAFSKRKYFYYRKDCSLKQNIKELIKDIYRVAKKNKFDQFLKNEMRISEKKYNLRTELKELDLKNIYDVYIVGSDQVWNTECNKRSTAYILDFVSDNQRRCAYAASIGAGTFNEEEYKLYESELGKFRVLSIREESAIKKYEFLHNAQPVLDPTLLLEEKDYLSITSDRIIKQKYAFLYTICEDRNLRSFAKRFCKEHGLILVDCKKSFSFFMHSSPKDFLSYIYNAEYVFTNSFHGTAFSVIFGKKFATEVDTKQGLNERSRDLLLKLQLIDRDIDEELFCIENEIDFASVREQLNLLRVDSVRVLEEILEKR